MVKKQVAKKRKRLGRIDLAAKALREAMWHVIERHRSDDGLSVKQAMRRVFADLDRRGTGYLGLKDLRAALQVRRACGVCVCARVSVGAPVLVPPRSTCDIA